MRPGRLHSVERRPLRYLVRDPDPAPLNPSPPLLCFLHGYGEAAPFDMLDALTVHGPLRAGNPAARIDPFMIIAPQLPTAGDIWRGYEEAVHQIVLHESKRHGCDVTRWYLTGFSFGGNGVFDLALAQPDVWAALWPVDPTRVPLEEIPTPIWLSLGEISRHKAQRFIERLALQPADTAALTDRVWTDEGQDHGGTARLAYRDERVYRWLLSKRRM